jgi:hypothetical protein
VPSPGRRYSRINIHIPKIENHSLTASENQLNSCGFFVFFVFVFCFLFFVFFLEEIISKLKQKQKSRNEDFAQIAIQALLPQQNLAYKSYEAFQAIKKMAAFGTLLSRYEQSPEYGG